MHNSHVSDVTTGFSARSFQTETVFPWDIKDYIYITAEAVVSILTIVVNGLVLAALWRYSRLRTVTNYYIGSLAVADILVGLLCLPLVGVVYAGFPKNFHACVLVNSLVNCFINVSVLSIVCVAFERHMAVRYPMFHLRFATKKRASWLVAAMWALGTVLGSAAFMGLHTNPEGFQTCSYRRVIHLYYTVYLQFFGFLLPILLVMLVFYVRIFYAFRTAEIIRLTSITRKQSLVKVLTQPSKKEMKLSKSLALIFALFALCIVPLYVVNCIRLWSPATPINRHVALFTVVLTHFNSVINPIVYAVNEKGFRSVLNQHLRPWVCPVTRLQESNLGKFFSSLLLSASGGQRSLPSRVLIQTGSTRLPTQTTGEQQSFTYSVLVEADS